MESGGAGAGRLLRGHRQLAGLSQRQLAVVAGVSVGVVRDLEQGRSGRLAARSAEALAMALGLDSERAGEFASAALGRPGLTAAGGAGRVRLGVLGPLAAWRGGVAVDLGPVSQRAVLGLLALSPGELVGRDALIEAWWGQDPPRSAASLVQARVSRLRQILDPGRAGAGAGMVLVSAGAGYRLDAGAGGLDLLEFRDLAGRGDAARRAGRAAVACGLYERALGLWRGDPLAGIGVLRAYPAVTGLSRRRGEVMVSYAGVACELGWYERALPVAGELAGREPLDEAAHAVLMIALAGTGRQAVALEVFEDLRRRLDEELGVRPGRELAAAHLRVLRADLPAPTLALAAPARAGVRYSLPPDTAAFTGRDEELARIASSAAEPGGVIAIAAIGGMPGVGKTALAVHAAHMLKDRFPDRQLFVSLHGHTPGRDPVRAEDALAGLLVAAGADPRYLPGDLDGRAALWRDKMARQRALLVLDNAAGSSQVTPLLPGGSECLVLVTSRRHLGDLPGAVTPMLLDALPPQRAADMFTRLAPRTADSPGQVAEVTRLAGFLPLAVFLLARVLARHPSWTLADLISDLAGETGDGLLTLTAENASIAAAFDLSYRHLNPEPQRLFRLLGLHPGATTDAYAVAALAGTSLAEAAGLLDGLHAEGLLTETGYRRYGMHDLLRRYARDKAAAGPDHEQALGRLLDYYQHAAALAQARLTRQSRPGPPPAAPAGSLAVPALADAGQALAWARADRDNLLACLDHATGAGQHARVVALTAALAELLRRDGPWAEAITRHGTALQAARRLGDRPGQAGALTDLGFVRRQAGDDPGAARDLQQALTLYRDLGDQPGQAGALTWLGGVRLQAGDYPGAARDLDQALTLCRGLGDQLGQATALTHLGDVRRMAGDYPGAARDLDQALALSRGLGDRRGQADALTRLGAVRLQAGDYPGAARDLEQALSLSRDLGERLGQADAFIQLGDVRRRTGDYPGAVRDLEQALTLCRDLGSRLGQASALTCLGHVRRQAGDYPEAVRDLEQALALYRDLGSRLGQANALSCLGAVRRQAGDYPGAARDLEQALALSRGLGDRGGEAEVLNEIGTLHRASGELARARQCHQQALELARATTSASDEASALAGLGRCALAAGQPAQAGALLRQAHEIFQRTGAAEAPSVLAELSALTIPEPHGKR